MWLALLQAARKVTSESPLKAPVWLLPAALDAVAFMAIWTGLSGWSMGPQRDPAKRRRRRAVKGTSRAPEMPLRRPVANDNLIPFSAA